MKIRFCDRNKGKGKIVQKLREEFPDLDIRVKGCIDECSTCDKKPMARVEKVRVSAADGEKLYQKIVEVIGKGRS